MFRIRPALVSDIPAMRLLFRETVLSVNRRDYTAEEVADWASCGEGETHWRELFARQRCFVAEDARGKMTGFASADGEGYMHMLFVHKDFQRCGVATALYAAVERFAREAGQRNGPGILRAAGLPGGCEAAAAGRPSGADELQDEQSAGALLRFRRNGRTAYIMNIEEFRNFCLSLPGAHDDFPFGKASSDYDRNLLVFYVADKWFCFVNAEAFDFCTLRCAPEEIGALRERYEGVGPGWHMDKRHWISVRFDSDVPDGVLLEMVRKSYELAEAKLTKRQRSALAERIEP